MAKIEKLERVQDIRRVWKTEPQFSDWLISDDGLELLGEELGVEIEDAVREPRVGDFQADIVGHATGNADRIILVENQFNKTDHDHLGKLLTYATTTSAVTAIWIAEKISPDHQRVIDWLNENTPEKIDFFLVKIEAFRIAGGDPAPHFDIICRPNKAPIFPPGEEKAREIWRRAYWTEVLEFINAHNAPFRTQRPGPDAWSTIALGRAGFHMDLLLIPKRSRIGCQILITVPWKEDAFNQLSTQKEEIEKEVGRQLVWNNMEENKRASISLEEALDPDEEATKTDVHKWFLATSVAFYKAFSPRIRALRQPSQ
jgi:hypothetical protein